MISASWWTFLAAALKALPLVLQLVQQVKSAADARANQGVGYDQAVADGLKAASEQLAQSDAAVADAKARQAAHPNSDAGRDTEFRRD